MKRVLGVVMAVLFAASVAGCSKKTCETIADECDWSSGLEKACVRDYKDGGNCRDSLKELKKCVEDNGCSYYSNDCDFEMGNLIDDCNEIVDYALGG